MKQPPAPTSTPVTVIIVNYNTGELLTRCVQSVLASTLPVQVLISDNGSRDDSLTQLKASLSPDSCVRIVENAANLGFARANNRVLPEANSEYLLFLNPDCLIQPGTLQHMRAVLEAHPEAGMAGCMVRNRDGSEQTGCRRQIPTPWLALVRVLHLQRFFRDDPRIRGFDLAHQPAPAQAAPVAAISGAFMFVRRAALDKVGPLDEGYFLHCEDLDWCLRFTQAGYSILFVPEIEIIHAQGSSSASRPIRVEWHKHKGMVRFYRKFFRYSYPVGLMWLVIAAVWLRFAAIATLLTIKRRLPH